MIPKLYKINNSNKKELNQICELFANNFVNEPQYSKLSKDKDKIKKLIKLQTKQLIENKNNSIEIYSPNNKLQSAIILINNQDKKYANTIFSNSQTLKQFKKIKKIFGISKIFKIVKIIIHTTEINNIIKKLIKKSDYTLYNIAVDKKSQGKGFAIKLLNPILNKFDNEKLTCTLNTHNPSNIHIYEHFGFKLSKIKTEKKIKQYQMIRIPEIKKLKIKKSF